ncbi:MAG: GrpB family protein [Actinomycetota bacterium]
MSVEPTHELIGQSGPDPIHIVEYDGGWPDRYADWFVRLQGLVPSAVRIDHIGSTAVPGLPAKPTIDIQISVPDVNAEETYVPAVESTGVLLRAREPGHRYFRPPAGQPRVVHIHVCSSGSEWETDHLLFRDYLREHPEARDAYAALKLELADRYRHDRIAYTEAKTAFVKSALIAARHT